MRRFYIQWRTKNPRRELILTGINANNSKLKYGAFSFPSTMLIFKQAVNRQKTALFLSKAAIKRRETLSKNRFGRKDNLCV